MSRPGTRRGLPTHAVADLFDLPEWGARGADGDVAEALGAWRAGDGPVPVPIPGFTGLRRVCGWAGGRPVGERGCEECDLCRGVEAVLTHLSYHCEALPLVEQRQLGVRSAIPLREALGVLAAARWPEARIPPGPAVSLVRGARHAAGLRRMASSLALRYDIEGGAFAVASIAEAYLRAQQGDLHHAEDRIRRARRILGSAMPRTAMILAWDVLRRLIMGRADVPEAGAARRSPGRGLGEPLGLATEIRSGLALLDARGMAERGHTERALWHLLSHLVEKPADSPTAALLDSAVFGEVLDTIAEMTAVSESAPGRGPAGGARAEVPKGPRPEDLLAGLDDLRARLASLVAVAPARSRRDHPDAAEERCVSLAPWALPGLAGARGPRGSSRDPAAARTDWRRALGRAAAGDGFLAAVQAHLRWQERRLADRALSEGGAFWSPRPVLSFRRWSLGDGGVHGAFGVRWEQPLLEASCQVGPGVPHTGGGCWWCGVYAHASLADLRFPEGREACLLGVVELSGRVVEHARGYRAKEARVVAAAACLGDHVVLSSNPDWLSSLFAHPLDTLAACARGESAGIPVPQRIRNADRREAVVRGFLARSRREAAARYV